MAIYKYLHTAKVNELLRELLLFLALTGTRWLSGCEFSQGPTTQVRSLPRAASAEAAILSSREEHAETSFFCCWMPVITKLIDSWKGALPLAISFSEVFHLSCLGVLRRFRFGPVSYRAPTRAFVRHHLFPKRSSEGPVGDVQCCDTRCTDGSHGREGCSRVWGRWVCCLPVFHHGGAVISHTACRAAHCCPWPENVAAATREQVLPTKGAAVLPLQWDVASLEVYEHFLNFVKLPLWIWYS